MAAAKNLDAQTDTPDLELLYPFYLDTDMSMAFAAALGGGVALEREEVAHDDLESSALRNLRGNLRLFDVLGAEAGRQRSETESSSREARLVLRHTEASIFISLYDELRRTNRVQQEPIGLDAIEPNQLVAMRIGPAVAPLRRVTDQVLRMLDVAAPLVGLDTTTGAPGETRQQRRQQAREAAKQVAASPESPGAALNAVRTMLIALQEDMSTSGMVDVVVNRTDGPAVVITLDERFLTDQALELLHTAEFTVVGKVTHIWRSDEEFINLLRRSVLSLVPSVGQTVIWSIFALLAGIASAADPTDAQKAAMTAAGAAESVEAPPHEVRFGDDIAALQPVIQGPAIQVLPLAICA